MEVVAVAAECVGQCANQFRADTAHFSRLSLLGHQAAHRGELVRVAFDQAKEAHRRRDVQKRTMRGDPVANARAQGRQLARAAPEAVPGLPRLGGNAQRLKHLLKARLQTVEVAPDREAVPPQGDQQVCRQLTRRVDQGRAAPFDPMDVDLPAPQRTRVELHVPRRSTSADRNHRRMLAEEEADLAVVAGADLAGEPLLQREAVAEIDPAQQVGLH